jgi:hypothetical protein
VNAERGQCSWCGTPLGVDDGYRLGERAGERRAAFCRLEHVVPWVIQGAHWEAGSIADPPPERSLEHCAQCAQPLDEGLVVLVRHRGEYRVADGFCGVAHLLVWAKAGGRWV